MKKFDIDDANQIVSTYILGSWEIFLMKFGKKFCHEKILELGKNLHNTRDKR